jgi:Spy/CpxP family protein refolding chaperone
MIAGALLAGSASAQTPSSTTSNQTGTPKLSPLMLLNNKDVQKELNLTNDQIQKVNDEVKFQREARKNLREVANENDRNQKIEALNQRCEKACVDVLKNDQVRRLKQITYQAYGPQAMTRTEVVDALKFTPEQRQKIKSILDTTNKQVRNHFTPGGNRDTAVQKRAETVAKTWEQIMQVFTPQQKEVWKQMTGAPFQGDFENGVARTAKRVS